MPQFLSPDQKLTRLVVTEAKFVMLQSDIDDFVERFLTQDECWVHHFEPETKRQSMRWKHSISLATKKVKVVPSVNKVMASVF